MHTKNQDEQKALSVCEFARVYSISKTTVYSEVKKGRLKISKVGNRTLILKQAELAWVELLSEESCNE